MAAFEGVLAEPFAGRPADVTEENLQARIRGSLLMALSNKTGALLLTTGNKSELADRVLHAVRRHERRARGDRRCATRRSCIGSRAGSTAEALVIPESSIVKPPSAELRPNQTDQDSLPPYDVLDAILFRHVEQCADAAALEAEGFDPARRRAGPASGAHLRVQAQAGRARREGHAPGVRHGLADADRPGVMGSPLIALFGAGSAGRDALAALSSAGLQATCVFDNDRTRWGATFEGLEVRAPVREAFDGIAVVWIASMYATEIGRQLASLGIAARVVTRFDDVLGDAERPAGTAGPTFPDPRPAGTAGLSVPIRVRPPRSRSCSRIGAGFSSGSGARSRSVCRTRASSMRRQGRRGLPIT